MGLGPDFVTTGEAIQILGAHKESFYRLVRSGYIKPQTVEGKPVLPRAGLEEMWANRPVRKKKSSKTTDPPPTVPSDPLAERPPERNKRPAQPAPAPTASRSGPTPDYNTERAWTEYERNRGLMLANLKDEGLLVYREDMEQAYSAVLANMMARAYAAAKQIKLQIPHITIEEMNRIEKIVLDVFEETSQDDFEELPE